MTVTKNLAKKLADTGGIAKVEVITNGFDGEDFEPQSTVKNSSFKISHVGLLNAGRNPSVFWEVLDELCLENDDFNSNLEVVLAGTVDQSVRRSVQKLDKLKSKIEIPEYLDHTKVLELYQQSEVLLLLVNNTSNSNWILPGKLFEYFSAQRPILAFGQIDSEANEVMQECGYDSFLTYENRDEIKKRVIDLYESYKKGETNGHSPLIHKYDRKKLAGDLANLLNDLSA